MRGIRFLKALTIVMGVLIVVATTALVVLIARRIGGTAVMAPSVAVVLDEPAGTRIAGVAAAGDRLAVQLQGGGPDRVLLVDPRTGAVVGRIGVRERAP
jgi:Family of unknown function (DUF6476)